MKKEVKNKKIIKWILWLLPFFLGALWFTGEWHRKLSLFPLDNPGKVVFSYTDVEDRGTSMIDDYQAGKKNISLEYTLLPGYHQPYSGFCFVYGDDYHFVDLSSYDFMLLELDHQGAGEVSLSISAYIQGVSDIYNPASYYSFANDLRNYKSSRGMYKIPLKDFIVPRWWYERFNKPPPRGIRFKNVYNVNFSAAIEGTLIPEKGASGRMTLHSLGFTPSPVRLVKKVLIFLSAGYGLLFFLSRFARRQVKRKPPSRFREFQVKPLEMTSYQEEELRKVLEYVKTHYQDSSLSTAIVHQVTGISPGRINELIRLEFGESFKQWLNRIRVREAGRLLAETDRNIGDIAMEVGYNNVFYFNKIFRALEDLSPREYRKEHTPG